jgi:hypothetical protein
MNYEKRFIKEVTVEGKLQRHYEVESQGLGKFTVVVGEEYDADEAITSSLNATIEDYIETYATQRKSAYPSIADQLDLMYHGGYEAWKASIQAIKDKFPKP